MTAPCIIVTDGETRAALAAVRSLGASGYTVHVTASEKRSMAGASRHAAGEHSIGDATRSPSVWARNLEDVAEEVRADLILPITEVSIGTAYEAGICERREVVCPPRAAYEEAVDKHSLMGRAAAAGLTVPRGVLVSDPATLDELPPELEYPVVLKARRSRFLVEGRWVAGDAQIVRDPDELAAAVREPGLSAGALLQEFVPGHGEAIFILAQEGKTLAAFAHRRIREKPPTGGVSVMRESIVPDPELLTGSERLLEALDWTGVAMVEFRRPADGPAVLLEINPRLWGSLQLAIDAGVDFPSLLIALHRGETVVPPSPRIGVRCRWLLGDLDHLLISLRRRQAREATGRRARQVVGDFVRGFFDGSRTEVCRRDDLRPFGRELLDWWKS
jgi:predicted ATP-grasp superfamily ATP-dependent carboligase